MSLTKEKTMSTEKIKKIMLKLSMAGPNNPNAFSQGAVAVFSEYLRKLQFIDTSVHALTMFQTLERTGIYGLGWWGLFKDNCDEDIHKFALLIKGFHLGLITPGRMQEASLGRDKGLTINNDEWELIKNVVYKSSSKTFATEEDWNFIKDTLEIINGSDNEKQESK